MGPLVHRKALAAAVAGGHLHLSVCLALPPAHHPLLLALALEERALQSMVVTARLVVIHGLTRPLT